MLRSIQPLHLVPWETDLVHPFSTAAAPSSSSSSSGASARAVTTSGRGLEVLHEILDPHSVDHGRAPECDATASRRKAAFLPLLSTRWTAAPGPSGERAGDDQPGKAGAGAEIDPDLGVRRERQELERVGDVPGPDRRDRRAARSDWCAALHRQQQFDEAIEPRRCFT